MLMHISPRLHKVVGAASFIKNMVTLSMKPSVIRPYKDIIRALIMTYSDCYNDL